MPLNLPENSLLDGLFTSGLRFVSTYPGLASSGRVATARYEMLHLTEPGHSRAAPGGGNQEFLIPTHLHEIFCWVHQEIHSDLITLDSYLQNTQYIGVNQGIWVVHMFDL